jgi:hypothetical protein
VVADCVAYDFGDVSLGEAAGACGAVGLPVDDFDEGFVGGAGVDGSLDDGLGLVDGGVAGAGVAGFAVDGDAESGVGVVTGGELLLVLVGGVELLQPAASAHAAIIMTWVSFMVVPRWLKAIPRAGTAHGAHGRG